MNGLSLRPWTSSSARATRPRIVRSPSAVSRPRVTWMVIGMQCIYTGRYTSSSRRRSHDARHLDRRADDAGGRPGRVERAVDLGVGRHAAEAGKEDDADVVGDVGVLAGGQRGGLARLVRAALGGVAKQVGLG